LRGGCRIVLRLRRRNTCQYQKGSRDWKGKDIPAANGQGPLCEVFQISWFCAKWRQFTCIIFPEKLSLVECPLRGVSARDVGVLGVRHVD